MFRKLLNPVRKTQGFTLVEMIGVLAIIAILIALLLPKIFGLIGSANARSTAAAVRTYETAVINYFADIGSIYPLNATGVPTAETTGASTAPLSLAARLTLDMTDALNTGAAQWVRFRGPYTEKLNTANPPGMGTTILMPAEAGDVALGAAPGATEIGWDLTGDGLNDVPLGAQVAYLQITGIALGDHEDVDAILDPGVGATAAERQIRGRVKYDTGTTTLYIYLAHR